MDIDAIVTRVSGGDLDALAELVFVHYRAYLCGVVLRHNDRASDDEIEETLHAFYEFMTTPTADGEYRLRSLNPASNPMIYVGRMLDNRLRDLAAARSRRGITVSSDENAIPERPDDDMSARRREFEIRVLFDTIGRSASLPPTDRYILYTYLLASRFIGGVPLKLSERLGMQLGMNPSAVYSRYDRALKRLRAEAKEQLSQLLP